MGVASARYAGPIRSDSAAGGHRIEGEEMSDEDNQTPILDFDWLVRDAADRPKLPQSRRCLRAAQWGFDTLVQNQYSDTAFVFHVIGVLAVLRAVQHTLHAHDRKLSPEHDKVISAWWKETKDIDLYPDLKFIKTARDKILKGGNLQSHAINTESSIGEGTNRTVTKVDYELVYYDDEGKRHDLKQALASALSWCDRELDQIEAQLP
jgi:hypothetical protein